MACFLYLPNKQDIGTVEILGLIDLDIMKKCVMEELSRILNNNINTDCHTQSWLLRQIMFSNAAHCFNMTLKTILYLMTLAVFSNARPLRVHNFL